MTLPRIWGQGQLFAYSALDGDSFSSDDLAGYLSGDRIGIIFCLKDRRELAFTGLVDASSDFTAVTSDYFRFGTACTVLFVKRNILIGEVSGSVRPGVFCDSTLRRKTIRLSEDDNIDVEIAYGDNDEYTGLAVRWNRFAFVYGHSEEEVISLTYEAFRFDIAAEEEKKLAYYRRFGAVAEHRQSDSAAYAGLYPALYAKCLSVMKTQLYSPEGEYTMIRSTPDRLPHKKVWLWDSVFHAIGFRHMDTAIAKDLIMSIFVHQTEDGFIPHMADLGLSSSISQPPIIAWGALKVYESVHDKNDCLQFLSDVYDHNKKFLDWFHKKRRMHEDTYLYTWNMTDDVNCRCDESGMDNSPRFDGHDPLYAIDLACFMANDITAMAKIAHELGYAEDEEYYKDWFSHIRHDVNELLWSEEDGFYFDYNITKHDFSKVWSVASFLPVFAGLCTNSQCDRLAEHLNNPDEFGTAFPIPSISAQDPTYGSDMWRGPVWINFNYMIAEGFKTHGTNPELGESIVRKTLSVIDRWYHDTGCIFEFYDSTDRKVPPRLNRKGTPFEPYNFDVRYQTIRDFGWSSTLTLDMLNN